VSLPRSPLQLEMASSDSPAGLLERVHDFVSENKRAILIGTAAAAIAFGGVAYYASTSSRSGGRGDGDIEKGRKKKPNKSGKKKKSVKDPNGPILEERERPTAKVEDEGKLDHYLFN
jgi:mitochondrial import receptor subunit TOM70